MALMKIPKKIFRDLVVALQLDKIKLQVDKIEFALGGHVLLNGKFVPLSKFM
jgi:hypothetical protein